MTDQARATFTLSVLFLINTVNFFDRQILGAIIEPIRREWGLSDFAVGALGTAFTLLYAAAGVPLGRLTDNARRARILSGSIFIWSIFTAVSGLARNFWQLFVFRLGVGIGEATCAPAAASLIGDLFPPHKRARALSIFMMGLPIGVALSYAVSGVIARSYGWRAAFFVAGIPGLICAIAALMIHEPKRGGAETHNVGARKRAGSPYLLVLSIPTMWWIIVSGALHNFNMYAIGSFLTPFLMRFHGIDIANANFISMIVLGLSGIPGLFLGGIIGDAIMKRRANGRLLVGALAISGAMPLIFFALGQPRGNILVFTILMGIGCAMTYTYYATVYSTIQDVIEPSLRGTAMALYFFAMYVLGASFGPLGTGFASDYFTKRAAIAAGVTDMSQQALEPFRAEGLHLAMYIIPVLGVLLILVLFAGSRTVVKDMERLQNWMRESAGKVETAKRV
jgi:predicted MFS family arabinose efflux permease